MAVTQHSCAADRIAFLGEISESEERWCQYLPLNRGVFVHIWTPKQHSKICGLALRNLKA